MSDEVKTRIGIETKIAKKAICELIKAGYTLGVHDGEELVLGNCTDQKALIEAMQSVDEEHLMVYKDNKRVGWVFFVYGNSGWDVIADYTTNLESVMESVTDYANTFED